MPELENGTWRQLLLDARTHNGWSDHPVDAALLRRLYELARMGPTAMNCQPVRLLFVKSQAAKERLRPTLAAGNVDKTMAAPVTAIVAYDTEFYLKLTKLAPHSPDAARKTGGMEPEARRRMALLSATLQGGYIILAARGLGLDCGPMGGFDAAKVDAEFFPDGAWKSIFLLNLGHGDPTRLHPRAPRLDFDEACRIA
ncbi:MAG TPA: malonic semialdehyde reductase [Myxococcota bacterium]|nr:malonic semialdehyde reductase [Myxococcota bacterium]HRY94581.1 malonic semialdehyde reductase [Myxococcota bacterium]